MKKLSRITVRIADETMNDLTKIATELRRDEAWVARDFIEQGIMRYKKRDKRK